MKMHSISVFYLLSSQGSSELVQIESENAFYLHQFFENKVKKQACMYCIIIPKVKDAAVFGVGMISHMI